MVLDYYDGYTWDEDTKILSPYSLISFLQRKELQSFWYENSSPRFLMELIKNHPDQFLKSISPEMTSLTLATVDLVKLDLVPLMFQTGYLTIDERITVKKMKLKVPNMEVSEALFIQVMETLTNRKEASILPLSTNFQTALQRADAKGLEDCFQTVMEWIAHPIALPYEAFYHAIFFCILKTLQYKVETEINTSEGRLDMFVEFSQDKFYIFEFKYEPFVTEDERKDLEEMAKANKEIKVPKRAKKRKMTKAEEEKEIVKLMNRSITSAKDQMEQKSYAAKYLREYKEVHQVAVGLVGRSKVSVDIF
jgi:hypothetical protein